MTHPDPAAPPVSALTTLANPRNPGRRRSSARVLMLALLAACLVLTGCRAVATAAVLGVAAGFVIAAHHYDPPPHYHTHSGWYWYHDDWHRHPPHPVRVEYYWYRGHWYRSHRYHETTYSESRHYDPYD